MTPETGLFDALRRVAGTALAMLHSRIELATMELGEAGRRLFTAGLVALFATLLLVASLAMVSAWLVLLLWSTLGSAVLGLFALVYLLLGVGLLWWVRRQIDGQPPMLGATMAELRRDATLLRRGSEPGGAHDER